jgi:hypothetical protein
MREFDPFYSSQAVIQLKGVALYWPKVPRFLGLLYDCPKSLMTSRIWGGTPGTAQTPQGWRELHIEQGPVLESSGSTIGVVTGIQGTSW